MNYALPVIAAFAARADGLDAGCSAAPGNYAGFIKTPVKVRAVGDAGGGEELPLFEDEEVTSPARAARQHVGGRLDRHFPVVRRPVASGRPDAAGEAEDGYCGGVGVHGDLLFRGLRNAALCGSLYPLDIDCQEAQDVFLRANA